MDESHFMKQAILAARTGRKAEARQLLAQVLQANSRHEQAWLWMSAVVESDAERVRCLQQVLAINPDNTAARKGLEQFQVRVSTVASQPDIQPPVSGCSYCGATNRTGARFCSGCGQALKGAKLSPQARTASCPSCGFDSPPGVQFCGKCGQKLGVGLEPSPLPSLPPRRQVDSHAKVKPGIQLAKGKRVLWIAGAVLGTLMVCVIGGWLLSLGAGSIMGPQSSPESLAEAAILTFYKEGDAEEVISWYSPDYRQDAAQRIRQSGQLGAVPNMRITNVVVRPRGSKGWMQANVLCTDGEESYDLPVIVENLGGKWYIVSINYRY